MEQLHETDAIDKSGELLDANRVRIIRRLGVAPFHYLCDDKLQQDHIVFEMTDGEDEGQFRIIGRAATQEFEDELRDHLKDDEGGGGIAPYESVLLGIDLSKLKRIFQVTTQEFADLNQKGFTSSRPPRQYVSLNDLE